MYPSIGPNSSILDEAFIGDVINDNEDGSDYGEDNFNLGDILEALPSPDLGFNESITHAPNIDDNINPRMIDFIDDPLEMEIQDYIKALDITNEDWLFSLEYMLDEMDQTKCPDPPEITFDNSEVFDEFDSSFASSCLNFSN